jgi:hypothetical protein
MGYHCFISGRVSCQYSDDAELLASAKPLSMDSYPPSATSAIADLVGLSVYKE